MVRSLGWVQGGAGGGGLGGEGVRNWCKGVGLWGGGCGGGAGSTFGETLALL